MIPTTIAVAWGSWIERRSAGGMESRDSTTPKPLHRKGRKGTQNQKPTAESAEKAQRRISLEESIWLAMEICDKNTISRHAQ
jgi:hypothetical protein